MIKKTIFYILLFSASLHITAQNWQSKMTSTIWNENNGFPANSALDMKQDYNGYLWIASYDGLIRFDGIDFKIFRKNRGGYPSDTARVIYSTNNNKLWIGTNGDGIVLLKDSKFTLFGKESGLPDLSVRSITTDSSLNLWIGTANGLLFVPGGDFSAPTKQVYLPELLINFIYADSSGNVWAITNKGSVYNNSSSEFLPYIPENDHSQPLFTSVFEDSLHRLWFGTVSGAIILKEADRITEITNPMEMGVFSIKGFMEAEDGTIWYFSEGGIGYMESNSEEFRIITEEHGLINNSVNSLFQDREKNIWIISDVSGIQKYSRGKFINFSGSEGIDKAINAVLHDGYKAFLAGSDEGLFRIENGIKTETPLTRALEGIRIRNIYKDSKSRIWISTYSNHGLFVSENNSIIKTINTGNGLSFDKTRCVIEDKEGFIWSGTRSGLNRINPETFEVEKIYTKENGMSNDYVLSLFEDDNRRILIGTDGGGINILDRETDKITVTGSSDGNSAGDIIFRITQDRDSNIWISTDKGVTLWKNGVSYNFTEDNGLPSNTVFNSYIDADDSIWFLSSRGVSRIGRKKVIDSAGKNTVLPFEYYDTTDGLLAGITPNSWPAEGDNGEIWFPTSRGISVFSSAETANNNVKPNAIVEEIKLDDYIYPGYPEIIEADIKRIDIDYTGFSYVVPEKTMFRYYLEGFDNSWSEITNAREISYTNLPSGNYTLYLKVSNNDGLWSDAIPAYKFIKKDFFYKNPYFYFYLTIFVSAFMLSLILLNNRKQEKRRNILHQVYVDAITSLAGAVEAKDPYTHGHVSRVKELSSKIGKKMNLSREQIENLEFMALLHDIGKIGIADTIIRKDGPLDEDEFEIMKQHPVIGSKIMADTKSLKKMALGARYHHEKYDGTGYPDNLQGDEIPLEARIISVADAFDAMTSDRPYRKGLSYDIAMKELNRGSGTQFDPEIIRYLNIIMNSSNHHRNQDG